ncbi:MAG TPA: DUF6760 family protein [Pyrinomonadaceae bacterium]
MRYPPEQMLREVAYIAYHFHWPREEIIEMPHLERQRWVKEISRINQEINETPPADPNIIVL